MRNTDIHTDKLPPDISQFKNQVSVHLVSLQHGLKTRPDLCLVDQAIDSRHYLGRFYVDSLVQDKPTCKFILDRFGEDKVTPGNDNPFLLGVLVPGSLIQSTADFSFENKHQLLNDNALNCPGTNDDCVLLKSSQSQTVK